MFTFPNSATKQLVVKYENIYLSEEKSKKIISHYETVIVKLREELSQQRQLLQKYRCKTRSQENTIVSFRKRVKATQEKNDNDKFKAKIEDKGVQCITMRSIIKDLKDEIEALQLEIDSTDENNNCNIEVSDTVFNTQISGRGTAYNHKIRQVYYTLRSICISVSKIDFVIRSVLSMVDIDIDFLPSKSTAANITSELGLVARQQLTEEMNNTTDCTMLRDATTKKGHHFYTTQIKTSDKTLTLGVKEVSDGKAQTYVSCMNEVVSDINIQNSSTYDYDYCTENCMNKIKQIMTDRSATENKVNEIICADNDISVNSFKCSVHPLLQFGTVAQRKVGEIEKNYKINQDLNLRDSIAEYLLRFVSKLFYKDGSGAHCMLPLI